MKQISMKVKTTTNKNGTNVVITREAELDSKDLSFQALSEFQKNIEKINKILKTATKKEAYVEFEIVTYEYNVDSKGYFSTMKSDTYRRWFYNGYPINDPCEMDNGVLAYYLHPDTRYTPENHDMVYEYTLESITA